MGEPWWMRAACRGMPLDRFFGSGRDHAAKAVCARCPVLADCLDEVLRAEAGSDYHRYGVFGGTRPSERRRLDRRRQAAP